MTPEELDQWRGREARRLRHEYPEDATEVIAARLAREGRIPPVVDRDILAFRGWGERRFGVNTASAYRLGDRDRSLLAEAYLAGARMAREQERERANVLVAYVKIDEHGPSLWTQERARVTLAKYEGEV